MANISSHFNSFLFNNKGGSWNSLQRKNKTATAKYIYSSVTTQTGPLGRRFSNPLISLRFLKTRFSSFFFCKWSNKIQDSTIQPLHWKLWNRLNLPDLSGNNPQIYDSYRSVWKKTTESFALEIVVIDNLLPSALVRVTVIDIFSSVYWFAIFEGCTKTRSSKYLKAKGEEA